MEKLQINHIAPYLPYGLKCQLNRLGVFNLDEEYPIPHNDICEITNLVKVGNDWEVEISGSGDCSFGMIGLDEIEIFLRPMSSLYKEIDGEVGIVELFKMLCTEDDPYESFHIRLMVDCLEIRDNEALFYFQDGAFRYTVKDELDGFIPNQLTLFTYLFQHHYDVFGLIDKGLAIDLNKNK